MVCILFRVSLESHCRGGVTLKIYQCLLSRVYIIHWDVIHEGVCAIYMHNLRYLLVYLWSKWQFSKVLFFLHVGKKLRLHAMYSREN